MKLLTYIFLFFSVVPMIAQQNQGQVIASLSRLGIKEKQVGTSILHVDYAMNADSIGQENTYIDLGRLEVGKECCKYYSVFLRQSIGDTRKTSSGGSIIRGKKKGKNSLYWNDIQYADLFFKDGRVTEYVTMPMWMDRYNCQFTEDCPPQQWTLHVETQTILGHKCQKATCHWRGRDYVAWFASDIPVRRGPWRFNGLPGLILKIYDTGHYYTFEAVSIRNTNAPIMLSEFKYPVSTRTKIRKVQRAAQVNFCKAIGGAELDGTPINEPDKPFEQLEKE